MKDQTGYNRSTSLDIQRNLFLGSLRLALTKIDDIQSNLMRQASEYLDQGMDCLEAQELLVLDGYDKDLAKAAVHKVAENGLEEKTEDGKQFGANFENNQGQIFSHADLGIVITATNHDEAVEKAEEIVANSTAGCLERVIDVFEI